jgi:hypothetical protein
MTVTDEDRKAARAVWIQAAFDYGGQSIPGEGEERAARVIADFIADTSQAAYAAGLERAAVIAEKYDDKRSLMTGVGIAVAAIRAEKDKT